MDETANNPVTPLPAQAYADAAKHAAGEGYAHRSLVAFDVLVNVLADGNPDETISSRMARWATEDEGFKRAVGAEVCRALNLVEADHGAHAELNDLGRAENVERIEKAAPTVKEEMQ